MKARNNLSAFLAGSLGAKMREENRKADGMPPWTSQEDDPVVSIIRNEDDSNTFRWKLLCKQGIEIECDPNDKWRDAGEAREMAYDYIEKNRTSIRFAVLKRKHELNEATKEEQK